jgi:ATP-dependent DNA ligase
VALACLVDKPNYLSKLGAPTLKQATPNSESFGRSSLPAEPHRSVLVPTANSPQIQLESAARNLDGFSKKFGEMLKFFLEQIVPEEQEKFDKQAGASEKQYEWDHDGVRTRNRMRMNGP